MISHVFRPRRRNSNGKIEPSRIYRGRYRLQGTFAITEISLGTSDKQVAEKKLAEIIAEKERERAGLIAPRLERDSAQEPISKHLADFAADLKALGRCAKYIRVIAARIGYMAKACSWRLPGDMSANSFVAWRSQQTALAPKTLNEYLNAANALLNWMERQGRIAHNPLAKIPRVDTRGKQQRRRAFTDNELDRLLAVAGDFRLLYLAAAFTGLRAGELQQLVWDDLHFDGERPHIVVRAATAKNRREAVLPLHPQLAEELKKLRTPETQGCVRVFPQYRHPARRIRTDMEAAGIPRIDSMNRKLDFHALRYTFATKLARNGVSQRMAQELLRHSDPRLTANIYTDVTMLPTFDAVTDLAWQAQGTGKPEDRHTTNNTQLSPQNRDADGRNAAEIVVIGAQRQKPELTSNKEDRRVLSATDTEGPMAARVGIELSPAGSEVADGVSLEKQQSGNNTQPVSHDSVARWHELAEVAEVECPFVKSYRADRQFAGVSNASATTQLDSLNLGEECPALARVINHWFFLPHAMRFAIEAIVSSQPLPPLRLREWTKSFRYLSYPKNL